MDETNAYFQKFVEKGEQQLHTLSIEFTHQGRSFHAQVETDSSHIYNKEKNQIELVFAISENSTIVGKIYGVLGIDSKGKLEFTVQTANNFTNPNSKAYNPALTPIRGLVATFVAEMITRGIIDTWISDSEYSDNAATMYNHLRKNPQLSVSFVANANQIRQPSGNAYVVKMNT